MINTNGKEIRLRLGEADTGSLECIKQAGGNASSDPSQDVTQEIVGEVYSKHLFTRFSPSVDLFIHSAIYTLIKVLYRATTVQEQASSLARKRAIESQRAEEAQKTETESLSDADRLALLAGANRKTTTGKRPLGRTRKPLVTTPSFRHPGSAAPKASTPLRRTSFSHSAPTLRKDEIRAAQAKETRLKPSDPVGANTASTAELSKVVHRQFMVHFTPLLSSIWLSPLFLIINPKGTTSTPDSSGSDSESDLEDVRMIEEELKRKDLLKMSPGHSGDPAPILRNQSDGDAVSQCFC